MTDEQLEILDMIEMHTLGETTRRGQKESWIMDARRVGLSARIVGRAAGMSHTGILKMWQRLG